MAEVLLAGYYGLNNIGDEAILEMFIDKMTEYVDKECITVLSGNPDKTIKRHNVKAIDRKNLLCILKAVKKADAVIFGGGSLLQDVTSSKSIYYYLFIIMYAKISGKKIIMLSQGIGPVKSVFNRKITAAVLKMTDFITVRDDDSYRELIKMGISREFLGKAADPVINYISKYGTENKSAGNKKKIGISFREWKDEKITDKLLNIINRLKNLNYEIYLIPFHHKEDMALINRARKEIGNDINYITENISAEEMFRIISGMDILIGVRLHSLIMAVSAGVPVIGISYDPKVRSFLEKTKCRNIFEIGNIDENLIIESVENIQSENDCEPKIRDELIESLKYNDSIIEKILNMEKK